MCGLDTEMACQFLNGKGVHVLRCFAGKAGAV
jgi:hypothetical protein